jgi:branched-chain amino acid transport system substrate-binding protein
MAPRLHSVSVALSLTMLLGACTSRTPTDPPSRSLTPTTSSPTPPTPAQVKVAFIEDLSSDEAAGRVLPALHAAGLAFANATLGGALPAVVDLIPLDTQGDTSQTADIIDEIATDPTYVAAVIAPYLSDQAGLAAALDAAGVPILSLSSRRPALGTAGLTSWRRIVANRAEEVAALAAYVAALPTSSGKPCVARGPDLDDARWAHLLARTLGTASGPSTVVVADPDAASSAAAAIADTGCGVVVWAGSVEIAEALRTALTEGGSDVVLVGGDELKDDAYPDVVGPAGDGTVAFCPCADLSLSTDLAAQRFIQDYQAEHGLPPGPYAAEAWDAAKMVVRALRSGAASREEVLAFLDASGPFQGLANRYEFTPGGELVPASAVVRAYRDRGSRWIELSLPA